MTEIITYIPFLLSAVALFPTGNWIVSRKVRGLNLPDDKEEEAVKTADLILRFNQVFVTTVFNSLYGDVAILHTLASSEVSLARNDVIVLFVALIAYHIFLSFGFVRILIDYEKINIQNLDSEYLWSLTAKNYLLVLALFFTLTPALITAAARIVLL